MSDIIEARSAYAEYVADRTARHNVAADAISALPVGAGVSVTLWTDSEAYTIIKRTRTTITLQEDKATLEPSFKPEFIAGGFVGHCINQADQTYTYEPNPNGAIIKITLRRWADDYGNERRAWKRAGVRTHEAGGNAYAGRRKFHDYNF